MPPVTLLSLPSELILEIISYINDRDALINFIVTCSKAFELAEPSLYRTILLHSGRQVSCLAKSLRDSDISRKQWDSFRPDSPIGELPAALPMLDRNNVIANRVSAIHEVDMRGRHHNTIGFEDLTSFMRYLPNLCTLSIESPYANYALWSHKAQSERWAELLDGYSKMFDEAGVVAQQTRLQRGVIGAFGVLKKLTLHLDGMKSRIWDFDKMRSILVLPALEDLTVSRASMRSKMDEALLSFKGGTCLRHLTLIECIISGRALVAFFALPRALETAYIGHNPSKRKLDGSDRLSCAEVVFAVQQQRHSLRSLTYNVKDHQEKRIYPRLNIVGPGLSKMTRLESLTIECPSPELLSLIVSQYAPPNLRQLRIHNRRHSSFDRGLEAPDSNYVGTIPPPNILALYMPSLKKFDCVLQRMWRTDMKCFWHSESRRARAKLVGNKYQKRGIGFSIYAIPRVRWVPPYLYGERVPEEVEAYNHDCHWFSPELMVTHAEPDHFL